MRMSRDNETMGSSSGGIVLGGLGILFVALKLTGYIHWSWWWVLAPFWGPIVIAFFIACLLVVGKVLVGR